MAQRTALPHPAYRSRLTRFNFAAGDRCWASAVSLIQGERYRVSVFFDRGVFDGPLMAQAAGFGSSFFKLPAMPFARWWRARWLQPIARIAGADAARQPMAEFLAIELGEVRDVYLRVQARGRDYVSRNPDDCGMSEKLQKAVVADLKALASAPETVVSHEEFRAARQKREAPAAKAKPKRHADPAQTSFGF